MANGKVRHSVIAGAWYPGSAPELRRMLDGFLTSVPDQEVPGELVGLIAPHAGYIYSGSVAAYAYSLVQGRSYDVVAVVSPVHRMWVGPTATAAADFYETPLGRVPVSRDLLESLGAELDLNTVERDNEHSLEIQLPFLQHALANDFQLLPVMMGSQDWQTCERVGDALAHALKGRGALLVASTDLSHFHAQPRAQRLDQAMLDHVDAFDPQGLFEALADGKTEACGGGPVVAVMLAAKALGATGARVLKYATSGDVTGDYSSVVGYAAGAIYRE